MPKKGNGNGAGALVQPVPVVPKKKNKRKKSGSSSQGSGVMRLPSKSEIVCSVIIPKGSTSVNGKCQFDMKSIPYLGRFSDLFERWSVHSLKYEFRTACPTTQGGRIQLGFDWGSLLENKNRLEISQLSPTAGCAVYKDITLSLPAQKLMSRKMYLTSGASDMVDQSPGRLLFSAEATLERAPTVDFVVGEIWATYSVSLMDPRPA